MDRQLLRLFQKQVGFQCVVALIAANQLQVAAIRSQAVPPESREDTMSAVWAAVQGLLTANANIAKLCWGQGNKYEVERKPLRDSLGIGDDSPLKDVWMRNRFDRYDEDLDDWWQKSSDHNHLAMASSPPTLGQWASMTKTCSASCSSKRPKSCSWASG
jgi:hypothetical protein